MTAFFRSLSSWLFGVKVRHPRFGILRREFVPVLARADGSARMGVRITRHVEEWLGRVVFAPLGQEIGVAFVGEEHAGPSPNQEAIYLTIEHRWEEFTHELSRELMTLLRQWFPASMSGTQHEEIDREHAFQNARLAGLRINGGDAPETWDFEMHFIIQVDARDEWPQAASHEIVVRYTDWKITCARFEG